MCTGTIESNKNVNKKNQRVFFVLNNLIKIKTSIKNEKKKNAKIPSQDNGMWINEIPALIKCAIKHA